MTALNYLKSNKPLGNVHPNIGTLISSNKDNFSTQLAFGQRFQDQYQFWTWQNLFRDVVRFINYLKSQDLKLGDRVAFLTDRSYLRLIAELAVMAGGWVSVPIFKGYSGKMKSELLEFSAAALLITDNDDDFTGLKNKSLPKKLLTLDSLDLLIFSDEIKGQKKFLEINPNHPAIILFTSGTTAFPKGVMLSHQNIITQQKAHQVLWNLPPDIKVLSYLPWDHVFGSLFERFLTLHTGGCLCLDDSKGKDIFRLMENFSMIQPEYFFSVPLVYERIQEFLIQRPEFEECFFHPGLRFIFTASAPLPQKTADYFQNKRLPIVEGWGLTETSPSCTLTQPSLNKNSGNVGVPIPGVEIKTSEENEVLVRGPNVMLGYYQSPKKNKEVIDSKGWFKTGDLGEISSSGLKIFSRKDRIFKLTNGKKVNPIEIETKIKSHCPWVQQVYIYGNGKRFCRGIVFIGPNDKDKAFQALIDKTSSSLHDFNQSLEDKFKRIDSILLIQQSLSLEKGELTPSLKIRPNVLQENYRELMKLLDFQTSGPVQEGVWIERFGLS